MPYTVDELQFPALVSLPDRAELSEMLHPTRALLSLSIRPQFYHSRGVSLTSTVKYEQCDFSPATAALFLCKRW